MSEFGARRVFFLAKETLQVSLQQGFLLEKGGVLGCHLSRKMPRERCSGSVKHVYGGRCVAEPRSNIVEPRLLLTQRTFSMLDK